MGAGPNKLAAPTNSWPTRTSASFLCFRVHSSYARSTVLQVGIQGKLKKSLITACVRATATNHRASGARSCNKGCPGALQAGYACRAAAVRAKAALLRRPADGRRQSCRRPATGSSPRPCNTAGAVGGMQHTVVTTRLHQQGEPHYRPTIPTPAALFSAQAARSGWGTPPAPGRAAHAAALPFLRCILRW